MMRQGANSAVRFTSYSTLKAQVQKWRNQGDAPLPAAHTFAIGATAGIITVYSTMPLDVVKTRMQGLDARNLYKNSFDCLIKVVKDNGILSLWKGTTPRLTRLIVSIRWWYNVDGTPPLTLSCLYSSPEALCSQCMRKCMVYLLPRLVNENKPVSNFHVRVLGSNWCIIYEARLCRTLRIGKTLLEYNKLPQID